MSNIINTYLKIQKCTFQEYQNSQKDANSIYFITDTLQIFIGTKEYMTTDTKEEFEKLLQELLSNKLTEFQKEINNYISEQLQEIEIDPSKFTIDQIFNPISQNAQSGIAINEALNSFKGSALERAFVLDDDKAKTTLNNSGIIFVENLNQNLSHVIIQQMLNNKNKIQYKFKFNSLDENNDNGIYWRYYTAIIDTWTEWNNFVDAELDLSRPYSNNPIRSGAVGSIINDIYEYMRSAGKAIPDNPLSNVATKAQIKNISTFNQIFDYASQDSANYYDIQKITISNSIFDDISDTFLPQGDYFVIGFNKTTIVGCWSETGILYTIQKLTTENNVIYYTVTSSKEILDPYNYYNSTEIDDIISEIGHKINSIPEFTIESILLNEDVIINTGQTRTILTDIDLNLIDNKIYTVEINNTQYQCLARLLPNLNNIFILTNSNQVGSSNPNFFAFQQTEFESKNWLVECSGPGVYTIKIIDRVDKQLDFKYIPINSITQEEINNICL